MVSAQRLILRAPQSQHKLCSHAKLMQRPLPAVGPVHAHSGRACRREPHQRNSPSGNRISSSRNLKPSLNAPLDLHYGGHTHRRNVSAPTAANTGARNFADSQKVVFFDLDRTLVDCDTGWHWIVKELGTGRISLKNAAWAAMILAKYRMGLIESSTSLTDMLEAAGAAYEGILAEELMECTSEWFTDEMRPRLRPGAQAVIDKHRDAGDLCVIATSTWQFVADEAVRCFALDEKISTEFEVRDGCVTGRIANLAYGAGKTKCVQEWASSRGVDLSACTFYTDSMSDSSLLDLVGCPIVVNPDPRLAKYASQQQWEVVDWGSSKDCI